MASADEFHPFSPILYNERTCVEAPSCDHHIYSVFYPGLRLNLEAISAMSDAISDQGNEVYVIVLCCWEVLILFPLKYGYVAITPVWPCEVSSGLKVFGNL